MTVGTRSSTSRILIRTAIPSLIATTALLLRRLHPAAVGQRILVDVLNDVLSGSSSTSFSSRFLDLELAGQYSVLLLPLEVAEVVHGLQVDGVYSLDAALSERVQVAWLLAVMCIVVLVIKGSLEIFHSLRVQLTLHIALNVLADLCARHIV